MIDILAALTNAAPARGSQRCALAQFLDAIPADAPGREELIRLVESKHTRETSSTTRSANDMSRVLVALGFAITQNPIHDHRNHDCRCYR